MPRKKKRGNAAPRPRRRIVRYAEARLAEPGYRAVLILLESDGTEVRRYKCERSWKRLEHDGRWWRLNGVDIATGELIYLPEVVAA